jgi:hypothetical protein
MVQEDRPKSAVELAMERLQKQDAESGAVNRPLTDGQKTAIAEARSVHSSKVAELEILQRSRIRGVLDPAERERVEADYRRELQRLNDDLERKVERIRVKGD